MPLSSPKCGGASQATHCPVCITGHQPTCCECGDSLIPWHPEIYAIFLDNGWDWIYNRA